MKALIIVVSMMVVVGFQNSQAATLTTLESGPEGRIEFPSLTLTDSDFARGSKEGRSVVISGTLVLPKGSEGPVPAVILMHGSGGIRGSERGWAEHLPRLGIATFLLDSFTGRGIEKVPTDSVLARGGQTIDIYRALGLLVTHPRIDRNRIALMGFSRGGGQTLIAAVPRFRSAYLPAGVDFAAHVAFYPTLQPRHLIDAGIPDRPVRIFHGKLDDSTPIADVRSFVKRIQKKLADVQLFEFPNAHHSFDDQSLDSKPYKTSRGFTLAYDREAHGAAIQKVDEILATLFRLKR